VSDAEQERTDPPRRAKRTPSVAVTFLPATYVTMSPEEEEEKAVAALAGLLIEIDQRKVAATPAGALTSPAHGGLLSDPGRNSGQSAI
jgi:hypothetical protein